jgi:hypothetical protein
MNRISSVEKFSPVSRLLAALVITLLALAGLDRLSDGEGRSSFSIAPAAQAGSTYADLASGSLNFSITPATANLISANDNWSGFASVEGYFGENLTATHGIDPQTVLGTEFSGNNLPNTPRQVNANKGNPSAYNAGGLAEFDSGSYLAIGFQGNVQANPYLVFYINSLNRANVTISYDVTDIDGGSNNAVSPVALQYRVGTNGLFTNIPAGYIADATDGPNIGGRITSKSVMLPADAWNKPQVQIRIITTNAANTSGGSTPDEWVGVNNVVVSSILPTAAPVEVSGRVLNSQGRSVRGAVVSAYDEVGARQSAVTNTFGYYRFTKMMAGEPYVLSVQAKGYQFDSKFLSPTQNLANVDFISSPPTPLQTRPVSTAPEPSQPLIATPKSTRRKVIE